MKYRKKPVVIEAIEFNGNNFEEVNEFMKGSAIFFDTEHQNPVVKIPTLEGVMTAQMFDYIIKGVKGEFYPCKPDIFIQLYDLVE